MALARLAIVEAPSILGLSPSGVQDLPDALRAAGFHDRLGVGRVTRIEPPAYDVHRDPETGMLNAQAVRDYTYRLADAVQSVLEAGDSPVVLGGDCSILLGPLLTLARSGGCGLLFIDGHADFYQPDANVNGQAASSELAFATGRGPAILTRFDRIHPLVTDARVVALGMRDSEEATRYGSQSLPETLRSYDIEAVRRAGADRTAREALTHLSAQAVDRIWVHLDADVLDDAVMPAVDYRLPGGLSWAEAGVILKAAFASDLTIGLDVTIFNPRLDPDGQIARALADLLVRALGRA